MSKRLNHLIAVLLFVSLPARAQFHARYNVVDFTSNPQAVKRITITPLQPYSIDGTNIVVGDPRMYVLNASGSLIVSNMLPGSYRVEFTGPYVTTAFTNTFPDGTTGLISAANPNFIGIPTGLPDATLAYSKAQSDDRFAKRDSANILTDSNRFVGPVVILNAQQIVGNGAGLSSVDAAQLGGLTPGGWTNIIDGRVESALQDAVLMEETNGVLRVNTNLRMQFPAGTTVTNTVVSTRWLLGSGAPGTGITNNQDPTSIFNGLWGLHPDYNKSSNSITCYLNVPSNADIANSNAWLYLDFVRGNKAGNNYVFEYDIDGGMQASFATFTPVSAQTITCAALAGPNSRVQRVQLNLGPYYAHPNALAPGKVAAIKISRKGDDAGDNNAGLVYPLSLTFEYLAK